MKGQRGATAISQGVLAGLLLIAVGHGLLQLSQLAVAHWQQPALFGDSFAFVTRRPDQSLLQWLLAQHNEHRIIWARLLSLVETRWLAIPPGSTAIGQILALVLGCIGLWSWLCRRLIAGRGLQLLTALAGAVVLLNPWQFENFGWEFQTPWFLINGLVLLAALLLSVGPGALAPGRRWLWQALAALLPWVALSATGQGLAVAAAFSACAWIHSRRLGLVVSSSSALAGLTAFVLLPYAKPPGHPALAFHLAYFLRAWLGGPWQGLGLLVLVAAALLLMSIHRRAWLFTLSGCSRAAVLMPGLFSLLFAAMITLSRSGFGLEQAGSSRYVSHSLMLGLSALLALALSETGNPHPPLPWLGAALVLFTTVGSLPQRFSGGGLSYGAAWREADHWAAEKRRRFSCHARQAALAKQNLSLQRACRTLHPDPDQAARYFQGQEAVPPLGWHRQLLQQALGPDRPISPGAIRWRLEQWQAAPTDVRIQGWAFLANDPQTPLLLIAEYGAGGALAVPINRPRADIRRTFRLPAKAVGFTAELPRSLAGQPLQALAVGGAMHRQRIWQERGSDG